MEEMAYRPAMKNLHAQQRPLGIDALETRTVPSVSPYAAIGDISDNVRTDAAEVMFMEHPPVAPVVTEASTDAPTHQLSPEEIDAALADDQEALPHEDHPEDHPEAQEEVDHQEEEHAEEHEESTEEDHEEGNHEKEHEEGEHEKEHDEEEHGHEDHSLHDLSHEIAHVQGHGFHPPHAEHGHEPHGHAHEHTHGDHEHEHESHAHHAGHGDHAHTHTHIHLPHEHGDDHEEGEHEEKHPQHAEMNEGHTEEKAEEESSDVPPHMHDGIPPKDGPIVVSEPSSDAPSAEEIDNTTTVLELEEKETPIRSAWGLPESVVAFTAMMLRGRKREKNDVWKR